MRIFLLAMVMSALSFAALAMDIDSAKAQGLIGERGDGYIGAVAASPSAEVAALVKSL